jgi:hypothetical protein
MKNTYERAVAYRLLTVCAHHHSYEFTTFNHEDESGKLVKIKLEQIKLRERVKFLTKEEKKTLKLLYKVKSAAKHVSKAKDLFREYDVDKSGEIDCGELFELLSALGLDITEEQIVDAMTIIDIDGSGTIELSELLTFIKDHEQDAISRIKELTELPVMVAIDSSTAEKVKINKLKRYIPPRSGKLIIELVDSYKIKEYYQVMTSSDQKNIINLATKMGSNVAQMISYSFGTSKMRLLEAFHFYEAMIFDIGDKARTLSYILPHLIVPTEARMLISKVTLDDPTDVMFVRNCMGNALKPIIGIPCGKLLH